MTESLAILQGYLEAAVACLKTSEAEKFSSRLHTRQKELVWQLNDKFNEINQRLFNS